MHGTSNNVTIAGLDGSTSYNGILGSSINGTYTSISNVTLDSYDVKFQIVQLQHRVMLVVHL